MYQTVQFIHSWWAYLVVLILLIASLNAIFAYSSKKEYSANDYRISLFALIVTHIQLLIGIVLYFLAPYFDILLEKGMGGIMGNDTWRLYILEHPFMMIIAVILITVGYSRHNKKLISRSKFKNLAIFYTIALLVVLSRIPWSAWF